MSDEKFERDIRDALLADDPGAVPSRLWTRIVAIPDEAQPRASRPVQLIRWAMAAAAVVIVGVSVVLFASHAAVIGPASSATPSAAVDSPSSSAPATASPAPSASASPAPSAAPSPTVAASPAIGATGPIAISPADVHTLPAGVFAIRDGMAYARLATTGQSTVDAITVTDVATGTVTRLTTLPAGHVVEYPALAAAHVVWMESWYAKPPTSCGQSVPCNPRAGQPVLWKVVAVPLAGGPETELGTGTSSRTSIEGEGAAPQAPVLAADGDRVAYAIDAPTTGAPDASRLVVRSISTGAILRQIDMTGYVEQLHLAGQAILIGEGFDTAGAGSIAWGDATLLLARSDTTSAVKLDDHVIDSVIGTGLVAWSRADATDYSVRTAPLDTLTPTTIRIPAADVPAVPNPGAAAYGLTVAGPGLAWTISMADTTGVGSPAFVLWQPGAARARLLTGTGQADTLVAGDGLLGWSPYGSAAGTGAVPLATLWGAGG